MTRVSGTGLKLLTRSFTVRLSEPTGMEDFEISYRLAPSAPPGTYIIKTGTGADSADYSSLDRRKRFDVSPWLTTQPDSAGCDGTTKDLTEPSLWWREDDKMNGEPLNVFKDAYWSWVTSYRSMGQMGGLVQKRTRPSESPTPERIGG